MSTAQRLWKTVLLKTWLFLVVYGYRNFFLSRRGLVGIVLAY